MAEKIDMDLLCKYNLMQVCNWNNLENVAIEHHYSINNSLVITYLNVHKIQRALKKILRGLELSSSQFIGISSDIPVFCIPTLILGIISAGHAFVYLSKESRNLLLKNTNLNIQYIFLPTHHCKYIGKRVIKRFVMHKQSVALLKVMKNGQQHQQLIDSKDTTNNANVFAYAVTTSGSTGLPSIVRVTHASITANILNLKRIFELTTNDKIVHLTPLTFDPSIIEIFLSVSSGATLLTVSDKLKNNPYNLLMLLDKSRATFLSTTPSLLLHRWSISNINSILLRKDSNLRILLLGGEPFPNRETVLKMKQRENRTRLFNIYGITEVSCWASINEISFDDDGNNNDNIMKYDSLGTILSDTIFQVKSQDSNNIISEGEGLLYIGSNTRICAIDNEILNNLIPPVFRNTGDLVTINKNSEIKFNGRQDSCIKRFGTKIYLNELERHVKKLNFIEDSHVIFIQHSSSLNLFFTITNNEKLLSHDKETELINEIWDHVQKLSAIMRPDYIHYLEKFKVTKHGKICTDTLKKLCTIKECESDVGKFFKFIWKSQLTIKTDNESLGFIDLGGTSIMALEIFGKLTNKIGNDFPQLIAMLLENNTLMECHNYVIHHHEKTNLTPIKLVHESECNSTAIELIPELYSNGENVCQWQKCRGKTTNYYFHKIREHLPTKINEISSLSQLSTSHKHTSNMLLESIKCLHLHNLAKCVDASPTVFKCVSNDEIFVSVGSHSGIICTVQLSNNYSWKVELPGRIEASILVTDNFKGIVGCHDGYVYCIHLMTGEIYWKFQTHNIVKCLAVICNQKQNIFVGSYDRFVYCISMKSGLLVWKQFVASTCATPLIHIETGSVIFALLDGNCVSLDQITGKIRWKHQLASPIFSSPTLTNNHRIVIIADVNGNISALNIYKGNELWNMKISEHIFSDLATIYPDAQNQLDGIIIATKKGNIYRYNFCEGNLKCPKLEYKINCKSPIFASPWVDGKFLVFAQENGELQVSNLNNGRPVSTFKLAGECFSSPVLHQNLILVGCRDDHLYILMRKI